MKATTQPNGKPYTRLMKLIPVLGLLGMFLPATQAIELKYTFDNPGNTTTLATDSLTADGSQNGNVLYAPWTLVPTSGPGPSGSIYDTTTMAQGPGYMGLITADIINYTNAMTWSAAVKPTAPGSSGYTTLFWAGWKRGVGETHFYATPTGALEWYQNGKGTFTTTATGLFKTNQWQSIGVTFDGTAGGGTLSFYVDQFLVESFTGIGGMVGFGNAGGTPGNNSETVFGLPFNVGGALGSQYYGLADNIFIADRALSASEMDLLQVIPEPSSVALAGLGALVLLRRLRRSTI